MFRCILKGSHHIPALKKKVNCSEAQEEHRYMKQKLEIRFKQSFSIQRKHKSLFLESLFKNNNFLKPL